MPLYLSREDVTLLLTHDLCIAACEDAFRAEAAGEIETPPRINMNSGTTIFRVMPAMVKSHGIFGVRIYNIPAVRGTTVKLVYLLYDSRSGEMKAMMDAAPLRDVRTGSVAAIGAKYLARKDAETVGVIGTGRQARSALIAHSTVRKLARGKVFSPTKSHREAFAEEMGSQLGIKFLAADSAEEAVAGVDIVITGAALPRDAFNTEPVLRGRWLSPGTHVSSVGQFRPAELDDECVARASRIVIDSKSQFPLEADDITTQVKKGLLTWDGVSELHELVTGRVPGREGRDEITLLKTVGTAAQDLFPAARVYDAALKAAIGKDLGELFPPALGWYAGRS